MGGFAVETISPVYARFVLREVLNQGICAERLLSGTALSRAALESGGDIAREDFLTILNNGRRLSNNEQLGLMIGRHSNIIALGPIGTAAAIAPTVREGLQVLENYSRLHVTYLRVELMAILTGLCVRIHYLHEPGPLARFHMESAVMMVQNYIETLTGETLDDAAYKMGLAAPDYHAQYSKWLHSPVSFDHEHTSVDIPTHWLDRASPYFNVDMWHQATLMLANRLREVEGHDEQPYTQYVTALLRSSEPPLPDLSSVANRIQMSERTLNRRLNRESTNFRQIRGEVLGQWARQHLAQTDHSVEAIAALLGYRDTANFRRSFRSREGCSPSEFRRRAKH